MEKVHLYTRNSIVEGNCFLQRNQWCDVICSDKAVCQCSFDRVELEVKQIIDLMSDAETKTCSEQWEKPNKSKTAVKLSSKRWSLPQSQSCETTT